ncbi:hypothetical protein GGR51DRAFT_15851 [Nemania sp. FL0031]|nr:hypothetical protein GGR51DRAFT_15851 [Nemania sp. FL0031]
MSISNITYPAVPHCPPPVHGLYTTVYETILPAACETGQWMATYTVTETIKGDKSNYVTPTMPPGFVVTTVHCHSCPEKEIEITCPGAQPTGWGKPSYHVHGNGVTATVTATPAPAPAPPKGYSVGYPAGYPAAPTKGAAPPMSQGSGYGTGSGSGNGGYGAGSGSGAGSGYGTGASSGSGNGNGYGTGSCSGSGCGKGNGNGYGTGSGSGYGTGSGSGSGSGNGYGTGSGSGCGGKGCGMANNGTWGKPPVVSGAAATLGRSLMVGAGLAFLAGPFFLL